EHLEGADLARVLAGRDGPFLPTEAVDLMLPVLDALAAAHAVGIIHRDLKPANLFLTRAADGTSTVKVLDFGISKTAEAEGAEGEGMSLTKTTAVLGSPLYMSPEQMKSARLANERSDVWSLGAILYELLTGGVPFNAMTFTELVLMANMEAPRPIATIRNDVAPGLEAAVLKCLAKRPEDRFANVAELAWAIAPFGPPQAQASAERVSRTLEAAGLASTGPRNQRVSGAGVEPTTAGSITALSSSAAAPEPPRPRRTAPFIGAAALLVVGGAAAFFLTQKRNDAPAAADQARTAVVDAAPSAPAPTPSAVVVATPTATPTVTPSAAMPEVASAAPATTTAPVRPALHGKLPPPPPPPPPSAPTGKKNPLDIQIK
ncbi:MAG: serine/threonine-protein kinase, partial [Byssovorax sp.]